MFTAVLIVAVVWLALIVMILAFFHGASKLRRQGRRRRVRRGNVPKSWPVGQQRPLDTDATVTYISRERKEGNQ